MSKYKIYYTATNLHRVEVEANSEQEAIKKFELGSEDVHYDPYFCDPCGIDCIEEVVKVPEKFDLSIDKSHPV